MRIDGPRGGYAHHNGGVGVLLEVEGGNAELAKDICMHVAAMRPKVVAKEELDPGRRRQGAGDPRRGRPQGRQAGEHHRQDGRRPACRTSTPSACLAEQPFVKEQEKTVGKVAEEAGMKIVRFVHWELGKE